MKIAIFTDSFFPQINGIVTSTMNIAENMIARGHSILIVAPRYAKVDTFVHPHIKVVRLPSIPASFYDDFRWTTLFSNSTLKKLKGEQIDIIHFMTPIFVSYLGIKIARILKIPIVGTFHTFVSNPSYYKHLFSGSITITEDVAWNYTNLYYNAADIVTAPTQLAVDIIGENGCFTPLQAISNGIDHTIFDNSRVEEFKTHYALGNKVILYIGRVANEKNIVSLLDIFTLVQQSVPDAQLLIIGDGPQKEELEAYAKNNSKAENIIFTGAIPHKQLIKSGVFASSLLFATASETETQGITILEAQANKMIAIGTAAGGVIDLITDSVNGFLIEPNNKQQFAKRIIDVLTEKVDVVTMREKALELTANHAMKRIIDQWEELYTSMIEKNKQKELPVKDYLHLRQILEITKQCKVDKTYYLKKLLRIRPVQ